MEAVTNGERRKNITVMYGINAASHFIPPMFIFPRERLTKLLGNGEPSAAMYTNSKNGWIIEDIFV